MRRCRCREKSFTKMTVTFSTILSLENCGASISTYMAYQEALLTITEIANEYAVQEVQMLF